MSRRGLEALQAASDPSPCIPDELQQRLRQWQRSAGEHAYGYDGVAVAPGWKVGGWMRGVGAWTWGRPLVCGCGELMELLLKIEGAEWG